MHPHEALRRGVEEKPPENLPAALAWLWRMFATFKALFAPLPEIGELDRIAPEDQRDPYTVIAWAVTEDYARRQIRLLWDGRNRGHRESIRLWIERAREDGICIVESASTGDPREIDALIDAVAGALKGTPGIGYTLVTPEGGLRLNRKARRVASARTRRELRRLARRARAARKSATLDG